MNTSMMSMSIPDYNNDSFSLFLFFHFVFFIYLFIYCFLPSEKRVAPWSSLHVHYTTVIVI